MLRSRLERDSVGEQTQDIQRNSRDEEKWLVTLAFRQVASL